MKIKKLIKILKRVEKAEGNINVICGSFCGTNNGYIDFSFRELEKDFKVKDHLCGQGFSLHIDVSAGCKEKIIEGIKHMEKLGYTYYKSQYVGKELRGVPQAGLSPCDWHGLW